MPGIKYPLTFSWIYGIIGHGAYWFTHGLIIGGIYHIDFTRCLGIIYQVEDRHSKQLRTKELFLKIVSLNIKIPTWNLVVLPPAHSPLGHLFPRRSGVYVMYDKRGKVVYVGESEDLRQRFWSHKWLVVVNDVVRVKFKKCGELERVTLERKLIWRLDPALNQTGKKKQWHRRDVEVRKREKEVVAEQLRERTAVRVRRRNEEIQEYIQRRIRDRV